MVFPKIDKIMTKPTLDLNILGGLFAFLVRGTGIAVLFAPVKNAAAGKMCQRREAFPAARSAVTDCGQL